jgi:hypothetical protein
MPLVSRIISGGQTGVDLAALRVAQRLGLEPGGWCPPGRVCESGTIPVDLPLEPTPQDASEWAPEIPRSQRTQWNVRDSDATLVLRPKSQHEPDPGTDFTERCARRYGRPLLVCDPCTPTAKTEIRSWLQAHAVGTLNVAGPSESKVPGIGEHAFRLLASAFQDDQSVLAAPR